MKASLITTLAGAGALALISPATAADLRVPAKAPIAAAAPAFNWTGCYIGIHGGGGVLRSDRVDDTDWGGGALAGGQIGCNYQTGWLVLGVEGEGWWSGIRVKDSFSGSTFGFTETLKNQWDFDVALRVGAAFGNGLLYGKAGAVWGRFDYNLQDNSINERFRDTLSGLLLGVGLEYAFTSNWTGKIEYNYLNYVTTDVQFAGSNPHTESVAAEKHIVKVGLNYLFR